jgi:hypothetical protein
LEAGLEGVEREEGEIDGCAGESACEEGGLKGWRVCGHCQRVVGSFLSFFLPQFEGFRVVLGIINGLDETRGRKRDIGSFGGSNRPTETGEILMIWRSLNIWSYR